MTAIVLTRQQRDAAIADAYFTSGETIKALGLRFGLHYSQISRIVTRAYYGESR